MKVKVEYTLYKTMEVEVPKKLSEAWRKAVANDWGSDDADDAYDNISEFVDGYVKAKEGEDNIDTVIEWDEMED